MEWTSQEKNNMDLKKEKALQQLVYYYNHLFQELSIMIIM